MKNLLLIIVLSSLAAVSFTGCAHQDDSASYDGDLQPVAESADSPSFTQGPDQQLGLERSTQSF